MNGLQSPEMELGSSSSSSNSPDQYSLNGLKFGKKIYFEDMGVAIPSKSGGGSSSSSAQSGAAGGGLPPAAPPKKVRGGVYQGGGQTPRCQVEGCKADLSDCKAYYSRHKVCGMHSKSPKVIVAGIEQRFCQQCSRFHLLVEFDQGKRSCRRRLAGHNERRRKPPAGSFLSPRYGSLIPAIFGNNGKQGGFVMDFTAYPKLSRRDLWPSTASPEQYSPDQTTVTGKFPPPPPPPPPPWQSKSENLPPHLFLPGSANRTGCTGPSIPPPPADIFTGVSPDSSCALSLLSNQQPWGSRTQHHSSLGMNHDLLTGSSVVQPDGFSAGDHFSSSEWTPDLFLGQISPGAELEMVQQQNGRQYGELDSSIQHMHWSL